MAIVLDGNNLATTGIINALPAQSATGTYVEFTGIPSSAKQVTVTFSGVSTSGTAQIKVQLGSTTYDISNYISYSGTVIASSYGVYSMSTGFGMAINVSASTSSHGSMILTQVGSNIWTCQSTVYSRGDSASWTAGSLTLTGALDRIRVIASGTGSPSDSFDAGTIGLIYQ